MARKVKSEDSPAYTAGPDIVSQALEFLAQRLRAPGHAISSPQDVKHYLTLQLAQLEHEEFGVLFLDAQHCVIEFASMFRGTLSQTSVYPREVLKHALRVNAAAVILAHNHPSGKCEPSRADEHLTQVLKSALSMIDVRVLDHVIVGGMNTVSFAERGLL